jgi:hypothetical protein
VSPGAHEGCIINPYNRGIHLINLKLNKEKESLQFEVSILSLVFNNIIWLYKIIWIDYTTFMSTWAHPRILVGSVDSCSLIFGLVLFFLGSSKVFGSLNVFGFLDVVGSWMSIFQQYHMVVQNYMD